MTNAERDQLIMEKLNGGMSLSDLQKLLESEYGLRMTYLDLRLLASTLQIEWEKQDKPKKAAPPPPPPQTAPAAEDVEETEEETLPAEEEMAENEAEEAGESATVVTVDETPAQGAAMSGSVKFASGSSGKWMMDRMGRLGLSEIDEGAPEPTQEDVKLFQEELHRVLQEKNEELQKAAFDGRTQVEISPVVRPGCDMNGTVQFASGASGEWLIAGGKVDFDLAEGSSKPTRDDIAYFQLVLSKKLREKGFGA